MTAATVCVVCSAVYPVRAPHTCTYEDPQQEGTPTMSNRAHRRPPPPPPGPDSANSAQPARSSYPASSVRMDCLRLAAESGMPDHLIATRAAEWADFVLGTTKKEN